MTYIQPKQRSDGKWCATDVRDDMAYAKSIWFEDAYEDKEDCEIAISDYLSFGCSSDFSDRMRGI